MTVCCYLFLPVFLQLVLANVSVGEEDDDERDGQQTEERAEDDGLGREAVVAVAVVHVQVVDEGAPVARRVMLVDRDQDVCNWMTWPAIREAVEAHPPGSSHSMASASLS